MTKKKKAPIDTYFVDSSECIGPFMHSKREGMMFAPNIFFLGRSGVKDIKGLKVAFLSGKDIKPHEEKDLKIKNFEQTYTDNCFVQNDIENLIGKIAPISSDKESASSSPNIDLFLACGWPYDIQKYTEYF